MKYVDYIVSLDVLHHMYPKYYSNELILLAEDALRWFNEEFPRDSSALVYLKNLYASPSEALEDIWSKIQIIAEPFINRN
jgi:hypothetical protein